MIKLLLLLLTLAQAIHLWSDLSAPFSIPNIDNGTTTLYFHEIAQGVANSRSLYITIALSPLVTLESSIKISIEAICSGIPTPLGTTSLDAANFFTTFSPAQSCDLSEFNVKLVTPAAVSDSFVYLTARAGTHPTVSSLAPATTPATATPLRPAVFRAVPGVLSESLAVGASLHADSVGSKVKAYVCPFLPPDESTTYDCAKYGPKAGVNFNILDEELVGSVWIVIYAVDHAVSFDLHTGPAVSTTFTTTTAVQSPVTLVWQRPAPTAAAAAATVTCAHYIPPAEVRVCASAHYPPDCELATSPLNAQGKAALVFAVGEDEPTFVSVGYESGSFGATLACTVKVYNSEIVKLTNIDTTNEGDENAQLFTSTYTTPPTTPSFFNVPLADLEISKGVYPDIMVYAANLRSDFSTISVLVSGIDSLPPTPALPLTLDAKSSATTVNGSTLAAWAARGNTHLSAAVSSSVHSTNAEVHVELLSRTPMLQLARGVGTGVVMRGAERGAASRVQHIMVDHAQRSALASKPLSVVVVPCIGSAKLMWSGETLLVDEGNAIEVYEAAAGHLHLGSADLVGFDAVNYLLGEAVGGIVSISLEISTPPGTNVPPSKYFDGASVPAAAILLHPDDLMRPTVITTSTTMPKIAQTGQNLSLTFRAANGTLSNLYYGVFALGGGLEGRDARHPSALNVCGSLLYGEQVGAWVPAQAIAVDAYGMLHLDLSHAPFEEGTVVTIIALLHAGNILDVTLDDVLQHAAVYPAVMLTQSKTAFSVYLALAIIAILLIIIIFVALSILVTYAAIKKGRKHKAEAEAEEVSEDSEQQEEVVADNTMLSNISINAVAGEQIDRSQFQDLQGERRSSLTRPFARSSLFRGHLANEHADDRDELADLVVRGLDTMPVDPLSPVSVLVTQAAAGRREAEQWLALIQGKNKPANV